MNESDTLLPEGLGVVRRRRRPSKPGWRQMLDALEASALAAPDTERADSSTVPFFVLQIPPLPFPTVVRILICHRPPLGDGLNGAMTPLLPDDLANNRFAHARDRLLVQWIRALPTADSVGAAPDARALDAASLGALRPLLMQTARCCYFVDRPDAELFHPIPLRDGGPRAWELHLSLEGAENSSDDGYALRIGLSREDQQRSLAQAALLMPGRPGVCIVDGALCELETFGCDLPALAASMDDGADARRLSAREAKRFVADLFTLAAPPRLSLPSPWEVEAVRTVPPAGQLHLSIQSNRILGEVSFAYGETVVPSARAGGTLVDPATRRQLFRDGAAETALLQQLYAVGFHDLDEPHAYGLPAAALPGAVRLLSDQGWSVFAEGRVFRRSGGASLEVRSGIDWFEVDGRLDFDGVSAAFPELLKALRSGRSFVQLGDGSLGLLPEQWLSRFGMLLDFGRVNEDRLRFERSQALLLEELLGEESTVQWDAEFSRLRERMADFAGIQPVEPPPGFQGELRPYQKVGLAWLGFLDEFGWGGCLADDMGLGKTVQLIARLCQRAAQRPAAPALAIVPRSVVFNWVDEARRFAPQLRVLVYHGANRHAQLDRMDQHDLVVTTYHTVRNDVDDLSRIEFDYVILDEAQAVKNPRSRSSKAVRMLRGRRRLALTGTPVENHLGDLWTLLEFLNPGMLGSLSVFGEAFADTAGVDPQRLATLRKAVRPFILRRTKEDVAPELPAKIEETILCEMNEDQQRRYDELREFYRALVMGKLSELGLARSKMHVLEALLRLRQAACHPKLLDDRISAADSGKMDALLPMLDEVLDGGHKALVFSQFTSFLAILRELLDARGMTYEYLDGATRDRKSRVSRFQNDDDCRLFLISLKAGGLGLNLTAADYVFILDPWWNPAVEAQAIDRSHRIGQDKKVIAYRLIAQGTVEEKIVELQAKKRDLAASIITESTSLIADLTREDLEVLLS